ncbi:MAG: DUF1194 domain-containing protein [Sneathiella sp.]|nr:DUF1194 domain-containing protein [Sneathiella sp.]
MMAYGRKISVVFALFILMANFHSNVAASELVDLELVLAVDCSYSVDNVEYKLQMKGLANAFRSPKVRDLINSGLVGTIAVTVIQWSKWDVQIPVIPWRKISSDGDILELSADLLKQPRMAADGGTSLGGIITFSQKSLAENKYIGARQVIDISSDGQDNSGNAPDAAAKYAVASGIIINGLAILNEFRSLDKYFEQRIIGGPGAFVIKANDYYNYEEAILKKLIKEISPRFISFNSP